MSAMSDYLENKLVDHIFRGQSFGVPTNLWFALYTSAPTDSGGGTEVSGVGYARVAIAPSLNSWSGTQGQASTGSASSGSSGSTWNKTAIQFGTPGAGGWGSVTSFAIFDASTGGNMLFHGTLTGGARTIQQNDTVSFPIDSLQISFA